MQMEEKTAFSFVFHCQKHLLSLCIEEAPAFRSGSVLPALHFRYRVHYSDILRIE